MTGENKLDYVEQRKQEILDRIEKEFKVDGLSDFIYSSKAEEYLNLGAKDLEKMTADECSSAAFTLSQYAMYLRKKTNIARAVKAWAENSLAVLAAKYSKEFSTYDKREYKIEYMAANDSYGFELQKIIVEYSAISNSYYGLSEDVNKMADKMHGLSISKGRDRNG